MRIFFFANSRSNSARTHAIAAPIPTECAISTSYACLRRRLNSSIRNRFFITRNTSRVKGKPASLISIVSGHEVLCISSSMSRMLAMRLRSFGRISLFIVVEGISKNSNKWIFLSKEKLLREEGQSFCYEVFFGFLRSILYMSEMKMLSFVL